ncbi:MAG: DUF4388 domain-containing protein [Pseudonocardia sp.]|nr:DUF4388 domain-containing protein [Pseudonocardia sp.]
MSLQGTFDTLSVTELFGLLSTAAKTGALRLEAGDHEAAVFVRAGRCCAVEPAGAGGAGLAAALVDVGFTLARQPEGAFRFTDSEMPERPAEAEVALEPAVAEILAMLDAWRDIEATIPSLDARLRLAPQLRGDEIVLRADEWAVLVALEARPTVRELVAARGESLIEGCRLVKHLVDRGAVEVTTERGPAAAPPAPSTPTTVADVRPSGRDERRAALEAATAGILDAAEPYAPEAIEPEPVAAAVVREPAPQPLVREPAPQPVVREPVIPDPVVRPSLAVEPEPVAVPEPVGARVAVDPVEEPSSDRGALLRLFSALKEN